MLDIITIAGYSGSGKTTLVCRLISEFTRRGLSVGTIKHSHHPASTPNDQKDSAKHRAAGAKATVFAASDEVILSAGGELTPGPEDIAQKYLGSFDLVLAEGYKSSNLPRIEIYKSQVADGLITTDRSLLIAVTGERPADLGDTAFIDPGDTGLMADAILDYLNDGRSIARLYIDGRRVYTKPFVQKALDRTVRGLVSALDGTENAGRIELVLTPRKK